MSEVCCGVKYFVVCVQLFSYTVRDCEIVGDAYYKVHTCTRACAYVRTDVRKREKYERGSLPPLLIRDFLYMGFFSNLGIFSLPVT